MKKKVLWISSYVPYDGVSHAGGKTHNHHIKRLSQNNDFEVSLISFYGIEEKEKIDLDSYDIKNNLIERKKIYQSKISHFFSLFKKNANLIPKTEEIQIIKELQKLKLNGYLPDYIVVQWTQSIVLIHKIKKIFGNSKYIAFEEDVTYLSSRRNYESKSGMKRIPYLLKYKRTKRSEISCLREFDLIVLNNSKDLELLKNENLNNQMTIVHPYFDDYTNIEYKRENKDIIFWGAMNRIENYESCIWFIKNVFHLLNDKQIRFLIVGANPHPILKQYESDRIIIVGFVDSISDLFKKSMCSVAPLLLGAGIKVKILEAFSSGIPTMTNSIGIEGIPAIKNKDFLYCEEKDEYIDRINKLCENETIGETISINEKKFINKYYSIDKSFDDFIKLIKKI